MLSFFSKQIVIFTLFCTFNLIEKSFAQKGSRKFDRITETKGLSNNSVNCIFLDSQGFIWFGTQNGLNRYDGQDFLVFRHNPVDEKSLSNNVITVMKEDSNKNLWIGTSKGLNIYNPLNGEFKMFKHEQQQINDDLNKHITALYITKEGVIWIGSENKGLSRYDPEKDTFNHFHVGNNNITAIYEDADQTLWVGTTNGINRLIQNKNGDLIKLTECFANEVINTIYEDGKQNIWVGTHNGLHQISNQEGLNSGSKQFKVTSYIHNKLNIRSLSHNDVKVIFEDTDKNLWVGTRGGGVNKIEMYGQKKTFDFQHFQHIPDNPNSLIQNEVSAIQQDASGILWIGTYNGISKITSPNPNFIHYQSDPFKHSSLANNNVAAIQSSLIKGEELMLLGSSGGINIMPSVEIHQGKEHFSFLNDNDPDLDNRKVQCLFLYEPGIVWIGTKKNLRVYDLYNKKFLPLPDKLNALPKGTIRKIYRDKTGFIWIGSYTGLYVWDPVKKELSPSLITRKRQTAKIDNTYFTESTEQNNVFAIAEDSEGNIWAGTRGGGLIKFKGGNPFQKPQYYLHNAKDVKTISSNYITAIHCSKNGDIWVGTTEGLNLTKNVGKDNTGQNIFTFYNKSNGFSSDYIAGILEDDNNNLWVATINSISKFNISTKQALNYHFQSGNINKENYTMGAAKDAQGYLYFGGMSGFLCFHPDSVKINDQNFPIVLTDLQVFNRDKYDLKAKNIIQQINHSEKSISLTYKDYTVSFAFASLNYAIADQVSYAYMLEGIDQQWINRTANQRYASYSNLNPGKYVLKVKATDVYGVWRPTVELLTIYVQTPFWKTWWAYLLYVTVILIVIYKIVRYILEKERLANNLKIERLEKEKVKEVDELKLNYFTNISHEFRTPLTLILAPLEQLYKQLPSPKKAVKENLSLIHHNVNHLLRLINQLMDFRKVEDGKMRLTVSQGEVTGFVKEIKDSFAPLALKRSISLRLNYDLPYLSIWCDWDKIEKILNNLLYNALSFTPANGKVLIDLSLTGNEHKQLKIEIKDTGKGISKDELNKIFDVFYQANNQNRVQSGYGIGLSLTKKLVDIHKGTINVESEPGKGTIFQIYIPTEKNAYIESEILGKSQENRPQPISYAFPEDFVPEEIELRAENTFPLLLLVDDNEDIRRYLVNCFHQEYTILEAQDGLDGLEKAINYCPDLIISDVMMPSMDGNEFCRKIKLNVHTSHIPVVMLTALYSTEHIMEGLETGADAYVTKPFHYDVLKLQVRKLIESRRALRKHFIQEAITQPKEVTVNSVDEIFLTKAMSVIEAKISKSNYTIEDFVEDMTMGRSVLYRKLKQLTDQSPNEFIRTVRLKRAANLLSRNTATIAEICYEVGFTDPGYFTKCFKRQFRLTPREFMDKEKAKDEQT